MGQVLHGSAKALAKRFRIDPKTVAKWRKRTSVSDLPTGRRPPMAAETDPIRAASRIGTTIHKHLFRSPWPFA
jgi:hypothetical protein